MRVQRVLWVLAALLVSTPFAKADTTTMQFTGVNGANNGVYYVSPYAGTMNYGTSSAQSVLLFCDDINNEVSFNQVWTANVTSLASGNFNNTRYGNLTVNPGLGSTSPTTLYKEAAWLVTQFSSHPGDYVSLQYALWNLMSPNNSNSGSLAYHNTDGITVADWLAKAGLGYVNINPANFLIITNTGPLAYTGQVQEFLVMTPEPATFLLVLAGVGSMFLILLRRHPQPT
jgi:hypothetical protein